MAIQSFVSPIVADFFYDGKFPRRAGWAAVASLVRRKVDVVHYANELADLRAPPGNRLEALHGNLKGFYSIRVNDQWRIVFKWGPLRPESISVVDYH